MPSFAESLVRAERTLQRTMGLPAVFRTKSSRAYPLTVLSRSANSGIREGDFRSRDTDRTFDAVLADIPQDWRNGTLEVSGRVYNVLDVLEDSDGVLAEIKVE